MIFRASASLNAPFVCSNAAFIIVSGVPGDAETESIYEDQLNSWLELLTSSSTPGSCLVFCDRPPEVKPPARVAAQFFKADRSEILRAPENIVKGAGALRVIVWGHGGMHGSSTVFHVHGPRLTPADFVDLSNRLPDVPCQWILMFRGSGAFARALAKPGREILASEDETAFEADPNGMPLLLKVARSQPAAPFDNLVEQLGRLTSEWYTERNLARTEEPTLWADENSPRHLAQNNTSTNRVAGPQKEVQVTQSSAPNGTSPDKNQQTPGTSAGIGWAEIKKANPKDYPDCSAIVLKSSHSSVLGGSPAVITEREEFIQILRPEGKRFGDFDVWYSPPQEELEFLDCEVLSPNGTLVKLHPESIGMAAESAPGDYQPARRKTFSLPGVVPGAVLHVRYRSQWKDYPLPRASLRIPLENEVPVLDATIAVRLPKNLPVHFLFEEIPSVEPKVAQTEYSAVYTWHVIDVAPASNEPLALSRKGALLVSTFADWHSFADWYAHITRMTGELTPALEQKAKELAAGAGTDREKIEAVFNYVAGLRYVAIPLGVNSIRPHSAANVFENQFGDCKDKANLLNTLLHALNIQAQLVLVPRFGQAYQGLPGLFFNHAISRVSTGTQSFWLDPTDEVCPLGLLPPGDFGRNVLVVDSGTAGLMALPTPDVRENRVVIRGRLHCSDREGECHADLTASTAGYPDYQLRRALQQRADISGSVPLLETVFRPASGAFALQRQESTPASALERSFEWHAEGDWPGLLSIGPDRAGLHSPFWIPREWDLALHKRTSPLFLNKGYPLGIEEEFEVSGLATHAAAVLPGVVENSQPPLSWRLEWQKKESTLHARLKLALAKGELSSSETALFQRQLRDLMQVLGADVLLPQTAAPQAFNKRSEN